jgi:hypothetical protein
MKKIRVIYGILVAAILLYLYFKYVSIYLPIFINIFFIIVFAIAWLREFVFRNNYNYKKTGLFDGCLTGLLLGTIWGIFSKTKKNK